jgi:actin-related protein 3
MGIAGLDGGPTQVVPTILYREERDFSYDMCREGKFPLMTSLSRNPKTVVGNAAIKESVFDVSGATKPIVDGRVNDWSDFEQYMFCCYTSCLKLDPSERPCILTEPPLNPSTNRERLAEVMFETFSVPSIYIGVQAVLALYAYWDGKSSVTGTVVDSGDGVTHVIPVTDGYVSGSSVRETPIGGKDVTRIISQALVAREEVVVDCAETAVSLNRLSKQIKEKLAYICPDPLNELRLYDTDRSHFKQIEWTDPRTKAVKTCDIGYERFMSPEIFFRPELVGEGVQSLPQILYDSVQSSPIDYRKGLFNNIVLSGGSTMFPNFAPRLELELRNMLPSGSTLKVNVNTREDIQRFAVWYGASTLSQTAGFEKLLFTRAQYDEVGPIGARDSTITKCLGL